MYRMTLAEWQTTSKKRNQLLYNCSECSHLNDELVPFPIGMSWKFIDYTGSLENVQNGSHNNPVLCAIDRSTDNRRRTIGINRTSILDKLAKNGIINTSMNSNDYFCALPQYKFVISPEGNGIDCHRHYEALMAGCIPIIERNNDIVGKYGDCPILWTNDYSEITSNYLTEKYAEMLHKSWDFSRLSLDTYDSQTQIQIKANGNYWGTKLARREWYPNTKIQEINSSFLNNLFLEKVQLPQSYFKKYSTLPPCPVKRYNYNWGHYDFPRNWCILDFIEWTKKHNIQIDHLGYTYEDDPELEFISPSKKTLVEYPRYDLHTVSKDFKDEFDFFLFNQTLEHLYNPFEAIKQIHSIVKPGGYVFTSVPTLNIPHMMPFHFNGFTPMGLAMLFKSANFEIVEIGQWGNYDYIQKLWATHNWPGYDILNNNNVVTNEERNVCQCWILAKKV